MHKKRSKTATQRSDAEGGLLTRAVAALHANAANIRQQVATLSLKAVRRLVEADLGLDEGALDGITATLAAEVDKVLAEQDEPPAGTAAAGLTASAAAGDLPGEVLALVLRRLDHDSLFLAAQACKAWRTAAAGESVWQALCQQHGWGAGQQPAPQPQPGGNSGGTGLGASSSSSSIGAGASGPATSLSPLDATPAAAQSSPSRTMPQQQQQQPSWRQLYRRRYEQACYECWAPTTRTTLGIAPLRLRLCRDCSRAYVLPTPEHRLLSKTEAMWRYCLRAGDLAGLPYALDTNPVEPAFAPMTLYRRVDVARAAEARWGGAEGVEAAYRRRLTR